MPLRYEVASTNMAPELTPDGFVPHRAFAEVATYRPSFAQASATQVKLVEKEGGQSM